MCWKRRSLCSLGVPLFAGKSFIGGAGSRDWRGLLQERITPESFEQAKALRLRFQDKPWISFTDLSSMVVMDELSIRYILTGDAHFGRVGMGFRVMS